MIPNLQPSFGDVLSDKKPYSDFSTYVAHLTGLGRSIFFDPCVGNNGDDLIIIGAQSVFSRLGSKVVQNPADSDVIVINGGGMFVEGYKQALGKVRQYSEAYPDKPLCIGPQSFNLTSNTLRDILLTRISPIIICAREAPTLENLKNLLAGVPGVEFLVDHDLAFQISLDHPIFKKSRSLSHILIVERHDAEHHSHRDALEADAAMPTYKKLLHRWLPAPLKAQIKRFRLRKKSQALTPFRQWVEGCVQTKHPHLNTLPRVTRDLAQREVATFDEYVEMVANSALVFTDRLHISILASRMGKETYLFEGNYHKNRGIYERSLKEYPDTKFVSLEMLKGHHSAN